MQGDFIAGRTLSIALVGFIGSPERHILKVPGLADRRTFPDAPDRVLLTCSGIPTQPCNRGVHGGQSAGTQYRDGCKPECGLGVEISKQEAHPCGQYMAGYTRRKTKRSRLKLVAFFSSNSWISGYTGSDRVRKLSDF